MKSVSQRAGHPVPWPVRLHPSAQFRAAQSVVARCRLPQSEARSIPIPASRPPSVSQSLNLVHTKVQAGFLQNQMNH